MPVELTANGTRGVNVPHLLGPLMQAGLGVFNVLARWRGARLLTLTTYGSRSGREHSVPPRYFPDAEHPGAWLIVASFGGTARHPAW